MGHNSSKVYDAIQVDAVDVGIQASGQMAIVAPRSTVVMDRSWSFLSKSFAKVLAGNLAGGACFYSLAYFTQMRRYYFNL